MRTVKDNKNTKGSRAKKKALTKADLNWIARQHDKQIALLVKEADKKRAVMAKQFDKVLAALDKMSAKYLDALNKTEAGIQKQMANQNATILAAFESKKKALAQADLNWITKQHDKQLALLVEEADKHRQQGSKDYDKALEKIVALATKNSDERISKFSELQKLMETQNAAILKAFNEEAEEESSFEEQEQPEQASNTEDEASADETEEEFSVEELEQEQPEQPNTDEKEPTVTDRDKPKPALKDFKKLSKAQEMAVASMFPTDINGKIGRHWKKASMEAEPRDELAADQVTTMKKMYDKHVDQGAKDLKEVLQTLNKTTTALQTTATALQTMNKTVMAIHANSTDGRIKGLAVVGKLLETHHNNQTKILMKKEN